MKIPSQSGGPTMEDSSPSQNHNGQLGPSSGGINVGSKQNDEGSQRTQYSIPGILHFIQHEWARFEMERSQWEVDRAELQARIAFLQGERKGQENLKNDLVRRIKMLEYALKQERAKYHKLKYGTELQQGDMKPPMFDEPGGPEAPVDGEAPFTSVSNVSWKQSRQLLRQYLQEIGYTDTIIDVRSNRVRALLGLNNNTEGDEPMNNASLVTGVNGNESSNKRASESQGRRTPAKKAPQQPPSSLAEAMVLDMEESVMASFDFLAQSVADMDDDDDMSDDMDEPPDDEQDVVKSTDRKGKGMMLNEGLADDIDRAAEEVLNELNLLSEPEETGSDIHSQGDPADWGGSGLAFQSGAGHRRQLGTGLGDEEVLDSTLGLGELAQLTVNNESESAYDIATTKESYRKTWNAKYTLRSHFDGVRALAFHPMEPVLITASEDHTLKLWNLQKTVPAKKSASLDVEPLYTFRRHTGPVLCLAMSATGEQCYSGGLDGAIYCWNLPCANIDPYDSFAREDQLQAMSKHTRQHRDRDQQVHAFEILDQPELSYPEGEEEELTDTNMSNEQFQRAQQAMNIDQRQLFNFLTESIKDQINGDKKLERILINSGAGTGKTVLFNLLKKQVSWCCGKLVVKVGALTGVAARLVSGSTLHRLLKLPVQKDGVIVNLPLLSDPGVLTGSMEGHTDAVWGLSIHSQRLQLLSCSADGTVKLWSPTSKVPLLSSYSSEQDGAPTSVDFVRDEPNRMVTAYNSAHCIVYDLEVGKPLMRLETNLEVDNNVMGRQINRVVAHPTLPLTITAHEDRHIRFFDNLSGKLVHSMVAHLDSVTSLAVDPNGLYLLSGSHDCSIRLWNMDNKTCVQEITAHRKKFDESIFDVAFHPSRPYIASAGADALAKVFV